MHLVFQLSFFVVPCLSLSCIVSQLLQLYTQRRFEVPYVLRVIRVDLHTAQVKIPRQQTHYVSKHQFERAVSSHLVWSTVVQRSNGGDQDIHSLTLSGIKQVQVPVFCNRHDPFFHVSMPSLNATIGLG